ncbi:MAG: hypothetical protein II828_09290 [Clostridia bacterium]|nr:hypothetical protein [Clostridia bacterium]
MENKNNQSMPTVAEIMKEVTQISSAAASEVPSVDSIQTPSVSDIPAMPQVDAVTSAAQAYETGQAAATASTAPTAQPAQNVSAAPAAQPAPAAPTAQPYSYQPVQQYSSDGLVFPKRKLSVGGLITLILGALLSFGGLILGIGDVAVLTETMQSGTLEAFSIVAFIILLLPLLFGILLLVLGIRHLHKKSTPTVNPTVVTINANTAANPAPVTYATQNVPTPTTLPNTTATTPTTGAAATASTGATPTATNYDYAQIAALQDETDKVCRRRGRGTALGSLALTALFWVLALALDRIAFAMLILPIFLAISSLRFSRGKSFLGWLSLIISIFSPIFFIMVLIMGLQSMAG